MSYISSLLTSLETRIGELRAEIAQLETVRAALNASTADAVSARNGSARVISKRTRGNSTKAGTPTLARSRAASSSVTSTGTAKKSRRAATSKIRRPRRSEAPLQLADLEQLIRASGTGLSASAIAAQAGVAYDKTLKLLRELETSGRVRREGSRRSTVWRLVSDDERIAQRAAELELLSTGRS
ncbi:MAG: hypothetical protein JO168_14330 [Solirubrobacterales bacterium]|nr:hypothetical protein [Solirubrobacterales bacterium]